MNFSSEAAKIQSAGKVGRRQIELCAAVFPGKHSQHAVTVSQTSHLRSRWINNLRRRSDVLLNSGDVGCPSPLS